MLYARMQAEVGASSVRVSMRSSAIGEDSELSFAGQYLTLLNVPGDQLLPAYKKILASLYTPRAISYRLNKGIRDEDIAMSVVCLQMVDAVASGVMYSHHPFNVRDDNLLISARLGLGTLCGGRSDYPGHLSRRQDRRSCHPGSEGVS